MMIDAEREKQNMVYLGIGLLVGGIIGFILGLKVLKRRLIDACITEKMIQSMLKPVGVNVSRSQMTKILTGCKTEIKKGMKKGGKH